MKLLAWEEEPERGNLEAELSATVEQELDAGMKLVTLLADHLPDEHLVQAIELVSALHRHTECQRVAYERELAWRKWVMARYYWRLTGNHVEIGAPRPGAGPTIVGNNIYDINGVLAQRKRGWRTRGGR